MADSGLKFNQSAWNQMIKEIVETDGVKRMERVADACNSGAGITDGYRVSVEGDQPLTQRNWRATVITATAKAIIDNAVSDRLVQNFHLAA